jgi:hypothetical protein
MQIITDQWRINYYTLYGGYCLQWFVEDLVRAP